MPEPISLTIALGLAAGAAGKFILESFAGALNDHGKQFFNKAIKGAAQQFRVGHLPANHDLEGAFYRSLGQASQVLAWHLHNPKRGPLNDLLKEFSDWPKFYFRFCEIAQGNLIANNPREYWLQALIERSRDTKSYSTFAVGLVLEEDQLTRLLHGEADPAFTEQVHREYLKWVKKQVPDNGSKPKELEKLVTKGWKVAGSGMGKLTFYDVFCLFFREELKTKEEVFRAFSLNVYTDLQTQIRELKTSQSGGIDIVNLEAALKKLEKADFPASFDGFKRYLDDQNKELYGFLRAEFTSVHERFDSQSKQLTAILVSIGVIALLIIFGFYQQRKQIVQLDREVAGAAANKVIDESRKPIPSGQLKPEFDYERVYQQTAKEMGLSKEEVKWAIENNLKHTKLSSDLKALGDAELAANEPEAAAKSYDKAAEINLKTDVKLSAAENFVRAGQSYRIAGKLEDAVRRFAQAISLISNLKNAKLWAEAQFWLGLSHYDLASIKEGPAITDHGQKAVTAFRAVLKIVKRQESPEDWALVQNTLGRALSAHAERTNGSESNELLTQTIVAYRAALEIRTRLEFPQDWATTQDNLGAAFNAQAGRTLGAESFQLLAQAVACFRAALEVRTRVESPQDWALTQNNLGSALWHQAGRTSGPRPFNC